MLSSLNLDRFKEKLGPLPVWAWGLIIGGIVVVIYFVYTRRSGNSTAVPIDDGGAAEAEKNFQQADSAIGAAEDTGLWQQILNLLSGTNPAPPLDPGTVTAPPPPIYNYGSGSGVGTPYTPASNLAPTPGINGKSKSSQSIAQGTGSVFQSQSAMGSGIGLTPAQAAGFDQAILKTAYGPLGIYLKPDDPLSTYIANTSSFASYAKRAITNIVSPSGKNVVEGGSGYTKAATPTATAAPSTAKAKSVSTPAPAPAKTVTATAKAKTVTPAPTKTVSAGKAKAI